MTGNRGGGNFLAMRLYDDAFRIWRLGSLGSVCLMRAEYSRHEFPRHWHDTYVIQTVQAGKNAFGCQGQRYEMQPGMMLVIHPHEVHDGRSTGTDRLRYRSMYPTESFWDLLGTGGRPPEFRERLWTDPKLARQFQRAHRALELNPCSIEGELMMVQFCADLLARRGSSRDGEDARAGSRQLGRARQLLEDSFIAGASVSELARAAGLSLYHFIRAFTSAYRLTPHEYLINLRVERARQLLASTDLAISEISAKSGFFDQSHLNRHFRSRIGVPPGVFRRSVR